MNNFYEELLRKAGIKLTHLKDEDYDGTIEDGLEDITQSDLDFDSRISDQLLDRDSEEDANYIAQLYGFDVENLDDQRSSNMTGRNASTAKQAEESDESFGWGDKLAAAGIKHEDKKP